MEHVPDTLDEAIVLTQASPDVVKLAEQMDGGATVENVARLQAAYVRGFERAPLPLLVSV